MKHSQLVAVIVAASIASAAACAGGSTSTAAPTAADAQAFLDTVDTTFTKLSLDANRAGWVGQNFITEDTEALDARMTQALADAASRFAKDAVKFDNVDVPADARRQLNLLKVSLVLATPADPKDAEELTRLVSSMRGEYGKGKWCADPAKPDRCLNIETSRRCWPRLATKAIRAAEVWHTISPPLRRTTSALSSCRTRVRRNSGLPIQGDVARECDMAPDAFTKELDRPGIKCDRSTCSCTRTCGCGCTRSTAMSCP